METLQRTANRGSISTGYDIDNSLKFEADNSQYIDDRHYTAGNRQKLTISFWFKRTELGQAQMPFEQSSLQARIYLRPTDDLYITAFESGGWTIITNRLFRDSSAWYHCVFQLDTTQSTAADRMKLWINGQQETSFSSASYPTQNADTYFNTNQSAKVGGGGAGLYFSGYMSEFFFIDDQALQASDFGEYDSDSGIWIPKEYDGTFGGQSYYLEFKNASNLADRSDGLSNGVNLSVQNITSADQSTDTPTNSFCTFNPTFSWIYNGNDAASTILNGATTADNVSGTTWKGAVGTMAVNKGKWYWEWENNGGAFGHRTHGILTTEFSVRSTYQSDDYSNQLYFRDGSNPRIINLVDASVTTLHNMTAYTSNNADVFGIALNMDDEEATFYRNGTAITIAGTSTTTIDISSVDGVTKYVYPLYSCYGSTEAHYNFGGYTEMSISSAASDSNNFGTFEYAPPSGYYALCTKNLAEYG
jgi:hypothetical protein